MDKNFEIYLRSTDLIDWEHPDIREKTAALFSEGDFDISKAEKIFYFIREIPYAFDISFQEADYRASIVLKNGRGFCTQKAILFCGLARCAGIPAGIHFFDITDHTLSDHFVTFLKTNTLIRHGIVSLYLNGAWRKYDATVDSPLAEKKGMRPVSFSPENDCLMSSCDTEGHPHIEYVKDHGLAADVSFVEIMTWFRKGYPHLAKVDLISFMVEREDFQMGKNE